MNRIVRYVNPTVYDKEKFGTIWETKIDDYESIFYIQASENEPNWLKLSVYIEKLLKNYYNNQIDKTEILTLLQELFI